MFTEPTRWKFIQTKVIITHSTTSPSAPPILLHFLSKLMYFLSQHFPFLFFCKKVPTNSTSDPFSNFLLHPNISYHYQIRSMILSIPALCNPMKLVSFSLILFPFLPCSVHEINKNCFSSQNPYCSVRFSNFIAPQCYFLPFSPLCLLQLLYFIHLHRTNVDDSFLLFCIFHA